MNIASKLTAGLVSIAFVASFAFVPVTSAQDSDADIILKKLQDLFPDIDVSSITSTRNVASTSNAACPFTWARNLTTGSTGSDVRQLQRFLNSDPRTQVAISGAGSPGNESSYYGPVTARAVSKFQELYAAQILTPVGLSKGTGGFYTSTRNHANTVCAQSSTTTSRGSDVNTGNSAATLDPINNNRPVRVSGDALSVIAGNQPGDAVAVLGAQRVPYTTIVLTAGSDDVRIEGIKVRRFGLSSDDNFKSVALVDTNGVQIGSSRSLNSRHEATLGGNFVVPRNRSVTLIVIGNIATEDEDARATGTAGFEVLEVSAESRVQGNFPIRGGAHVFSDSVALQVVDIEISGGDEIEFDEDTEIATVEIKLNAGGNKDKEDAYLRSITLEQTGSASDDEVGDVTALIDGDSVDYRLVIDDDRYTFNFEGKGVFIEESDSVDLTIEVNTDKGYRETVRFKIDDISDAYVVGKEYGFGLPVAIDTNRDESDPSEIKSGEISSGSRISFDDITYGNDRVLGALNVEFEGEDIDIDDLTFQVTLSGFDWSTASDNAWEDADEDEVTIENVFLQIDGETVAFADDDIVFAEPSSAADIVKTVDFTDSFTIDVRKSREVKFEILADLDKAWSNFDGTGIEFELTDVDKAEGVDSEKDYTATNEYFNSDRRFEDVQIRGNEIDFSVSDSNVDDTTYVAGTEDIIFATLEVDASNAVDDIELDNLYVSFELQISGSETGDLDELLECRILDDSGDEVATSRGNLDGSANGAKDQLRFNFKNNVVVGVDDDAEFDIVCGIDDDATAGVDYKISVDSALTGTSRDRIEYTVSNDDREAILNTGDDSDFITVSATGTLDVTTDNPDSDETVVAIAGGESDVATLEVEVEAESEDIQIKGVILTGVNLGILFDAAGTAITISEEEVDNLISDSKLEFGDGSSTTARPNDFYDTFDVNDEYGVSRSVASATNIIEFENVNETIGKDERKTFTISFDYDSVEDRADRTRSGNYLTATSLIVLWEGETSKSTGFTEVTVGNDFTRNVVFTSVPTVSSNTKNQVLTNGRDRKLYEFTVAADNEGDVYVNEFTFNTSLSGSFSIDELDVKRGGSIISDSSTSGAVTSSTSTVSIVLDEPERISAGETKTFSVHANDITGTTDNDSISIELAVDASREVAGKAFNANLGNFVWSPNSLDDRDDITSANTDWFNGWSVFESDDINAWTSDK